MRGRRAIEGTFACALIDTDLKSASHDLERILALGLKDWRMSSTY